MRVGSALLLLSALFLIGCARQTTRNSPIVIFPDMDYQHRYEPQGESGFYGDKRSSRVPVAGTVSFGSLAHQDPVQAGVVNGQYIGKNPVTVDADLLALGQKRFNTYCAPCHDQAGQGRGVVGQRALWIPTNLHEDRVKNFNDGELYNVITNGRRSMPSYRFQVVENDRWAIVAYVRALQRTTSGTVSDVPQELQSDLR
jgi:mono/diheme cytochrome c family protein